MWHTADGNILHIPTPVRTRTCNASSTLAFLPALYLGTIGSRASMCDSSHRNCMEEYALVMFHRVHRFFCRTQVISTGIVSRDTAESCVLLLLGCDLAQLSKRPTRRENSCCAPVRTSFSRPTQNSMGSRRGDCNIPPNKFWPTPGGAKEFLRPFIERNQKRLWAYDPALVGLNHVEAYHHIASKVIFTLHLETLLNSISQLNLWDLLCRFQCISAILL